MSTCKIRKLLENQNIVFFETQHNFLLTPSIDCSINFLNLHNLVLRGAWYLEKGLLRSFNFAPKKINFRKTNSNRFKQLNCIQQYVYTDKCIKFIKIMANLIQNNSKLIEQQVSQNSSTTIMQNTKREQTDDGTRTPKTIKIIKDQSGFGFNVRGQISGAYSIKSDFHEKSIFH